MFSERVLVLLCVLICVRRTFGMCLYADSAAPLCFSLQSAQMQGTSRWRNLCIYNNNNNIPPRETLTDYTLASSPKLISLEIKGLLNHIGPNVFTNLLELDTLTLEDNYLLAPNLSAPSLKKITLRKNNIKQLITNFQDMDLLDDITIQGNDISTIKYGVFNNLQIQKLDLTGNRIRNLETNAFSDMKKITRINLSDNKLIEFNSERIFGRSSSLLYLYLNQNQLRRLSADTFKGVPNLFCLYLGRNVIEVIEKDTFAHLTDLEDLCLSNNRLVRINSNIFGESTQITVFNISYNFLTYLSMDVLKKLPYLSEVSIVGNPWQCACWRKLRDEMHYRYNPEIVQLFCAKAGFTSGALPVCVVSDPPSDQCIETDSYAAEFSKIYYEGLAEYDFRPDCLFVYTYM